jgi:hypothetical protein
MKGSQNKKIKEVLSKEYFYSADGEKHSRMSNAILGAIGGFLLGAIFKQSAIITGVIGGIIGYTLQKR